MLTDSRVIEGSQALSDLYTTRFTPQELRDKQVLWKVLCEDVFQQYVPVDGTVLDLGAGNCEFINAIKAKRRIAMDLNPETGTHAVDGIEFRRESCTNMVGIQDASADTVFTSNFFEHLPDKAALMATLHESRRVLREGGSLVVLMPNVRYVGQRFWDYLDHYLPLTDVSLAEALRLSGFTVERVVPRFLPYTVRGSKLPVRAPLIRAYLRLPLAWKVLGGQMLLVASKPAVQRTMSSKAA